MIQATSITIGTNNNHLLEVESYGVFEIFGETFHITESIDFDSQYTASHEKTGFCIDVQNEDIETTKKLAIEFLTKKGAKKVYMAIRKTKWFKWKLRYIPSISRAKIIHVLAIIWYIFSALVAVSIIALAVFKLITGKTIDIQLSL